MLRHGNIFFCPASIGSNAILFADPFGPVTEKIKIKYVSTISRTRTKGYHRKSIQYEFVGRSFIVTYFILSRSVRNSRGLYVN